MNNLLEGLVIGVVMAIFAVLFGVVVIALIGLITNFPVLAIACVIPIGVAIMNYFTNGEFVHKIMRWFL